MGKSKWPDLTRRVACDSFVMTVDGKEYHPHAGEWVLLRQRLTPAMMQAILRFWACSRNLEQDTAKEYADALGELAETLAYAVLDWNWSGPDGAYPKPSAEIIRRELSVEEMTWLSTALQERDETNPTTPSPSS